MLNKVNREIPDEFLKDGKEVYQGKFYMDGKYVKKLLLKQKYLKNQLIVSCANQFVKHVKNVVQKME